MISRELKEVIDPNNECCCEYQLSHKCKEWAILQGYYICSGKLDVDYNGDSKIVNYTEMYFALLNLRIGAHSYNSKFDVSEWHEDGIFYSNT